MMVASAPPSSGTERMGQTELMKERCCVTFDELRAQHGCCLEAGWIMLSYGLHAWHFGGPSLFFTKDHAAMTVF